ncbi:Peptidoglycan-binding (PGRP) domain of peptidoglycan hydrolases-containing protein [Nocardioides exalbidus]|uniref:Peptidoglycan-binding (PGRP) domain of peptidoglycan hydrolases-containing protein n=1 Tax=Nocardioides exalbidus TaxID=402596 RepID=A0A1H4M4R9_9ACTN|nr:peptidoglycan-binding protein [Nocardioides exalbidus]SEB77505.1 Peptidoglycan-binding (PGRP) domain of peptidoglycan hydrolases-containing protein [Nocardioides exalbidus]
MHRSNLPRPRSRAVAVVLALLVATSLMIVAAPAQAASAWPVTQAGQPRNNNAMALQYLLTSRGYATSADGVFGSGTTTNLKAFQSAQGIGADGIAGSGTWPRLVVQVGQGSADTNAVKAAQTQLNKYGANLVADGVFGSGTRAAVVSFQASRGLSQSGTVDAATWQELLGWSQAGDQSLCYSTGGSTASSLLPSQVANVQAVLGATRAAGGNRNAQIIALMTAMQESKLCNIQFGDRDSLGLFQQRPSQGWCPGSVACVDPTASTQGFLGVSSSTSNPGLFDVSGWESMSKTLAADRVQRSCCPNAYAQWESMAATLADTY